MHLRVNGIHLKSFCPQTTNYRMPADPYQMVSKAVFINDIIVHDTLLADIQI